jgi:hypothetical protein
MGGLSEQQVAELRRVLALCQEATNELADSCETGMMSDAKSSVYAALTAVQRLSLPVTVADVGESLCELAEQAWTATIVGPDPYSRAGGGLGGIARVRAAVERLLEGQASGQG